MSQGTAANRRLAYALPCAAPLCVVPRASVGCPNHTAGAQAAMGGPRKRFIPSTFARAHDFVFSPEDAGAAAAADAATNASHNLVPPLRFCRTGSVEKATSRLTTATVPHNGDGQKEYCGACQFADTRRCTYCHQSKLSTAHRLPLDRLASLLMREDCNKATLEICRELALYARSDAHAAETNLRLGFDVPERAMCDAHERERERLRRSRLRESEELTKCRSKLDRALRAAREAAAKHALEQSQIEAARDAAVGTRRKDASTRWTFSFRPGS